MFMKKKKRPKALKSKTAGYFFVSYGFSQKQYIPAPANQKQESY